MPFRVCIVLLLWVSACAGAPAPSSMSWPHAFALTPSLGPSLRLVSAPIDPPVQPASRIGKADLEQAWVLLSRARNDLEPHQWEALNRKLTAAEQAFERFSREVRASGQVAEVSRGVEGLAQAGRARTVLHRVGPLLAVLILLYPADLASAEIDHSPSKEGFAAREVLWGALREVSEESQRIEAVLARHATGEMPDVDSGPVLAISEPKTWRNTRDPATGQYYTSVDEYDRVPRYANQTCKNSRLDTLRMERFELYNSIPPLNPKLPKSTNKRTKENAPCSRIRLRLVAMQKVLDKRLEIQKECFGGESDSGHDEAMSELDQGIANMKALEAKNCAPGHPMADR